MQDPSKLIGFIKQHSKDSSRSHHSNHKTHLPQDHHKNNEADISRIELPDPLNQYCQVVNKQHINHNIEVRLISASPYHTPATKSILTTLPPNSKEIANSIISKFKGTAVRSVVAMRRIEYTAQLNDKKRRHRHIIFIQRYWRHTYPRRLNRRVKIIQKFYRRHYSRMLYLIMSYYNKLFIEFQKRLRKIQLKYLFKIVIHQISLSQDRYRASIGIQAEIEVLELNTYMGLLLRDDKDSNDMKFSRGICNFPQRKNNLSRRKQHTSLQAINLRMRITNACRFEIKQMIDKHMNSSFLQLQEFIIQPPIRHKVIDSQWNFMSKSKYPLSDNIAYVYINKIQRKYREHCHQVNLKKMALYQSNGIQSFKLTQKTLFNTKLLVLYVNNLLKKKILKAVFSSLKKNKKGRYITPGQIISSRFAHEHQNTDSLTFQINNEMNTVDYQRMTLMSENCKGILTMSNGLNDDDTLESQDTFSQTSFEDFDEMISLSKKLPNDSMSPISLKLIEHLKL